MSDLLPTDGETPAYPSRGGMMFYVPDHAKGGVESAVVALDKAHQGLTKRELLAGMALQGWLAGCDNAYNEFTGPATYTEAAAGACVKFADALLKELAK